MYEELDVLYFELWVFSKSY